MIDPPRIEVSSASFDDDKTFQYVTDALRRNWLTMGPMVHRFETELARLTNTRHAMACSSGTTALHLALLAHGIGELDAVIVPPLTYIATANAARYVGAHVFFGAIREDDWTLDPARAIELAWSLKSDHGYDRVAILPVHLYDSLCTIPVSPDPSIVVIVDSAHAPTAKHWGVTSTHSFYASKVIACGEGGAVVTDDDLLAARARLYRGQGATNPGKTYEHSVVGYNYRLTDLQGAVALAQIESLTHNLAIRRALINRYRDNLASAPYITLQGGRRADGWMMAVLLPSYVPRDEVAARMHRDGISTRPFFVPIPDTEAYRQNRVAGSGQLVSDLARLGICLPTHTLMTFADVDRVCDRLLNAVREG